MDDELIDKTSRYILTALAMAIITATLILFFRFQRITIKTYQETTATVEKVWSEDDDYYLGYQSDEFFGYVVVDRGTFGIINAGDTITISYSVINGDPYNVAFVGVAND